MATASTATSTAAASAAECALGPMSSLSSRSVSAKYLSIEQGEGRGARVRRSIGRREVPRLDPFLMLDEFKGSKPVGFPDHPHRGFETISYLLEGQFEHQDFAGHKGILNPGDVQIMTAGRGIVHSEMVSSDVPAVGLQLWVNLPAKLKMMEPAYQELNSKEIGRTFSEDKKIEAILISGVAFDGTKANSYTRVPTMYIHFIMQPGAELRQPVPASFNTFAYTLKGSAEFGKTQQPVGEKYTIMFDRESGDDHVYVKAGPNGVSFVLIGGEPIGEPVVQHGPFVMNTQAEIRQAFTDFSMAQNGFERAATWASGH